MTNGVEILLIEDNPEDVEITLRAFQKYHLANKIHVARDGEEALQYLFGTGQYADQPLGSAPRLILLDLKLPKVDGIEILQRCKSDPRTKNIPVVVLTSSREERDLADSYNLGVNSYVLKPVDFYQFTEAIRQLGLYWVVLNQLPTELQSEGERVGEAQ
jgi:two-component system, response regulator